MLTPSAPAAGSRTCGCAAPPRWRCELCSAGEENLSCSRRCLEQHWRRHGRAPEALGARARREQAARNGEGRNWESFAGHRDRITRLLGAVQRAEGLCVLGAGNGDDLELGALVREFGEVHLVDLDGAALERARARLPRSLAERVLLHGDVDLTGLLDAVERWGEDEAALARLAKEAAADIAARLGGTFDVVLSSCVLSQLCAPFTRALARRAPEWTALMRLLGSTHFELMARLVRAGGTGVALGDTYHRPAGSAGPVPTWSTLDSRTAVALRRGVMRLRDPYFLAELLAAPPVCDLVASPRLTEPWLWNIEDAEMLVYAVIFQRSECQPRMAAPFW